MFCTTVLMPPVEPDHEHLIVTTPAEGRLGMVPWMMQRLDAPVLAPELLWKAALKVPAPMRPSIAAMAEARKAVEPVKRMVTSASAAVVKPSSAAATTAR